MITWAIPLLIIALISALLGLTEFLAGFTPIAHLVFAAAIVLFLISLIFSVSKRPNF